MKVKVNDIELELEKGTSAIDAVFAAGYDVPYFCSHEYMSPIGACRMCLAKVGAPRKDRATGEWIMDEATGEPKIFWFPKPMATCTTQIMEGMVIDTLCEMSQKAQAGMMEMHLINHPLDCPTCDKGGACELQDRAYEYGQGTSRFVFDKRHQEKHHALSELITLDRERCIHCKRCVRYFEEVPSDEVLDFIDRGGHTYIGTVEEGLPSNFSGNISDICPVGALLDSTSRFRGRNWEYDHTDTISANDASGAAIRVDSRTGRIERIKANHNAEVNKTWIDDGSRFGHEWVSHAERITMPLIRRNGDVVEVSWQEAAQHIAANLQGLSPEQVGILFRADSTLEEAVGVQALAAHVGADYDHYPRYASSVIPETIASYSDVATAEAILVVGDVTEEVPILDLRIKDALKGVPPVEMMAHGVPIADLRLTERMPFKKEILAVAAPYQVDLMQHAGNALCYDLNNPHALLEVLEQANNPHISSEHAEALSFSTGEVDAEGLHDFAKRLKASEKAVIILGSVVLQDAEMARAYYAFAASVGAKVLALGASVNSFGLEAMGASNSNYQEIVHGQGRYKALIVSNLNPANDASALQGVDFLVAHSCFHDATTALADVILPAKSHYEKEGTVRNIEGRFLPLAAAPIENGLAQDFTGIVKYLSEALALKARLAGRSIRSSRRELKKVLELDLATLPYQGDSNQPASSSLTHYPQQHNADAKVLVVPTMVKAHLAAYNSKLVANFAAPAVYLNQASAASHGIRAGQRVRISAGGVSRQLEVAIDNSLADGMLRIPALPEQPAGFFALDSLSLVSDTLSNDTPSKEVNYGTD